MNVQEQANPQEAAKEIWDSIDKEESGVTPVTALANNPVTEVANPAEPAAPAPQADAHATGEEDALTPREQMLMDKIAGLSDQFNQVQQRLRSAEGNIGGLKSKLTQRQVDQPATGDAPSAEQMRQAQADPKAMADLKRDFPEFATAMTAVLDERLAQLEQRVSQAQPQQAAAVRPEDIAQLRNDLLVERKHEGWQDTVQSPEFRGWYQRQPREVQMLGDSSDPRDAIRLLDLHTEAKKPVSQPTSQRLATAAAIPSGRNRASVQQKAESEMTKEELWKYYDELDRNKQRG